MRYLLLIAGRSRAPLPAVAAGLFALLGIYAYRPNEIGETWALTALLCAVLAAWLIGALMDGEPRPQADMTVAALGGRGRRDRLDWMLVAAVAAGLTVVFLGFPLALTLVLSDPPVFGHPVGAGDLACGVLAHLSCAALGGAVAVLFAPPRVRRRATAIAAVLAALLVCVAISGPLGGAGGPIAVAEVMYDEAGAVDGALLLACASCLAATAAALSAAAWWGRRSG